MLSSNVNAISLDTSKIEFLKIALSWFSNVETLTLGGRDIKILPKSLKKCHTLKTIQLDGCENLEEMRGIPPNLKQVFAFRCKSLIPSSKSILMSQELHKAGGTRFFFPSLRSERIPEWFEHQGRQSFSFSFRNNLPSLVFYFSSKLMQELELDDITGPDAVVRVYLVIKDYVYTLYHSDHHFSLSPDYTYLFHFDVQYWLEFQCLDDYSPKEYRDREVFKSMLDEALLKNEWIHAEVRFGSVDGKEYWEDEIVVESGIHVLKHLTNMDDIQFTDSSLCRNRKLDEYLSSPLSLFHSVVRLADFKVCGTNNK
ncbi:disease resistance protein [Trifolium medium]|uniref:Disease resistance protein n=1 Tax=Trifolium medium TaxID=97028 RepID=A0A392MLA9_9FABA|nr:disease resistance protein [Trifolium medium]